MTSSLCLRKRIREERAREGALSLFLERVYIKHQRGMRWADNNDLSKGY